LTTKFLPLMQPIGLTSTSSSSNTSRSLSSMPLHVLDTHVGATSACPHKAA
jgi:hypothetical protein